MKKYIAKSFDECIRIICKHAIKVYPFECCGLILGSQSLKITDQFIIFECNNIQNDLHNKDPEKFNRDAKTAYYIDPNEQIQIIREANRKNLHVIGIYHSHPNHDICFSEEDRLMALWDDEPVFPLAAYIIISVFSKEIKNVGIFSWNIKAKNFDLKS